MDQDLEKRATSSISPGASTHDSSSPRDPSKLSHCKFGWRDISYSVDTQAGKKQILHNVSGCVEKGKLLALMGPSGCGKTTLLNILARRLKGSGVSGTQLLAGSTFDTATLRAISTYVEQEDHLIGSLTVRETVEFAAKLALPGSVGRKERKERTDEMLRDFGLEGVRDTKIGTPLQRGVSGGQKRRVTTASQLITLPKIIFLDEPTSGLDSTSSHEIISCLRNTAQEYGMIVIASIHQPSTSTLLLFDNVLLLSEGKTVYFGPPGDSTAFFTAQGYLPSPYMSPAESMLELTNTDFVRGDDPAARLDSLVKGWEDSTERRLLADSIDQGERRGEVFTLEHLSRGYPRNLAVQTWILFHRMALKSYRDPLAYGVRIVMYLALAILMGTAWLRLSYSQENIQNVLNSLFFGSAFMSFMAVAYIPAYLEDRAVMVKERANGLYGPTSFLIANLIIGVPFLFVISLLFSVTTYWFINLRPGAIPFFNYLAILYLDLLAAESLVVLISSIAPIFVVALALTAFANGLWMTVGGFLVSPTVLNVFWKYTFYQFDYQRYAFSALVRNQMVGSTYSCGAGCECMFVTSLAPQCMINGEQAAAKLGFITSNKLSYGLLIAITVGMRLLAWVAVYYRKK